jgi:hypothetical protein
VRPKMRLFHAGATSWCLSRGLFASSKQASLQK